MFHGLAVEPQQRQALAELFYEPDRAVGQVVLDCPQRLLDDRIQVLVLHLARTAGGELQQTMDDAVSPGHRAGHVGQHHGSGGILGGNVAGKVIDSQDHRLQRILYLVRNPSRKGAHRLQLLRLHKLQLGGLEVFVRLLQIRQRVPEHRHPFHSLGNIP